MTEAVYSVSEINNFIKHILEQEPELRNLQVVGEISNFKRYPSGHCYFTLKDAGAVLKCVMFRSKAVNLRFQPQNGDTVVAVGRLFMNATVFISCIPIYCCSRARAI